jgi:membrane-bound lytic murein transglycosylase B
MLRRAWFVFAVLWAQLMFASDRDPRANSTGSYHGAVGPLFLPWAARATD